MLGNSKSGGHISDLASWRFHSTLESRVELPGSKIGFPVFQCPLWRVWDAPLIQLVLHSGYFQFLSFVSGMLTTSRTACDLPAVGCVCRHSHCASPAPHVFWQILLILSSNTSLTISVSTTLFKFPPHVYLRWPSIFSAQMILFAFLIKTLRILYISFTPRPSVVFTLTPAVCCHVG